LILACIVIELSDALSAWLGYADGYFTYEHLIGQLLTVGVALVPESIAIVLIRGEDRRSARSEPATGSG